ncbi:MAG TPA: SIMPL domain-containing protein [Blastocatellia bacterium]|nr:SIMPL domain-containing protein [Blastocatellia bacterium]
MVKMTRKITITLGLLAAMCALGGDALAQEISSKDSRPSIRVTGEATVKVSPDQAQIDIGVVTQAQNAQAAASQNAQKLDATIAALRKALGSGADIKTISYSVSPNYRYPREGGQPTITGYTASNIVQVKINDLTKVGPVIDTATQTGANTIHALRFTLKDEQAARAQALREAAMKARAKAEALASTLNLKIQRVLHVEEGGQVSAPPMYARAEMAMSANAQTPIEAGTIDVQATITLTVEVSQ